MLIKRSKNDIFNEVKKRNEIRTTENEEEERMKLSISFTDSVCFHSFCGTFRCRPLPMQYFMAKKKRRDAISCASHEFHWTFMLTYWTVTTQHSVHLISFKRRWKEKCMQKNLRIELLIFSRRPVGMNENDVNWSTFFALFFLLLEYFEHVEWVHLPISQELFLFVFYSWYAVQRSSTVSQFFCSPYSFECVRAKSPYELLTYRLWSGFFVA